MMRDYSVSNTLSKRLYDHVDREGWGMAPTVCKDFYVSGTE